MSLIPFQPILRVVGIAYAIVHCIEPIALWEEKYFWHLLQISIEIVPGSVSSFSVESKIWKNKKRKCRKVENAIRTIFLFFLSFWCFFLFSLKCEMISYFLFFSVQHDTHTYVIFVLKLNHSHMSGWWNNFGLNSFIFFVLFFLFFCFFYPFHCVNTFLTRPFYI